jgi:hypothetical protein
MQDQSSLREDRRREITLGAYVSPQSPPESRPTAVSSYAFGSRACGAAGAGEDPPRKPPSLLQAVIEHIKFEATTAVATADAVIRTIKGRR